MCSNYEPVTLEDRLLAEFGVQRPAGEVPSDFYPGHVGPFIRRSPNHAQMQRELEMGRFGLVPHWSKDLAIGRRTYNCRSETASAKPSFKAAWAAGRRCIIPAEAIYEPCYETGRAVRWRITLADGRPMGIAGLWGWWRGPGGEEVLSYTMLTVNADTHPLMQRMHKRGEEKRMVVILDEALYDAWLDCPVERMGDFMQPYPAGLMAAQPWPKDVPGQRGTSGSLF